eukprot:gene2335-2649_t
MSALSQSLPVFTQPIPIPATINNAGTIAQSPPNPLKESSEAVMLARKSSSPIPFLFGKSDQIVSSESSFRPISPITDMASNEIIIT